MEIEDIGEDDETDPFSGHVLYIIKLGLFKCLIDY